MNEQAKRAAAWPSILGMVIVLVLAYFALLAFFTGEWSVAVLDTAITVAIVVQVRLRP